MLSSKKWILAALVLCLLPLCALAQSEPLHQLSSSEYIIEWPEGLKTQMVDTATPGVLEVKINTEDTAWTDILSRSHNMAHLHVSLFIPRSIAPAGAVYMSGLNGNGYETDADALRDYEAFEANGEYGNEVRPEEGTYGLGGFTYAEYIAGQSCLAPREDVNYCYLRWYGYNDEGQLVTLRTDKLKQIITHTSTDAFHITAPGFIGSTRVAMNMTSQQDLSCDYDSQSGTVTYTLEKAVSGRVETGILRPDDTVNGWRPAGENDVLDLQNGYAVIGYDYGDPRGDSHSFTIEFVSGNTVVETVTLKTNISGPPGQLPWTDYNDLGWQKVPKLDVYNSAESAGYTMQYDAEAGILRCSFSGDMSQISQLDMSQQYVRVPVPTEDKDGNEIKVVSCKWNSSGCNNYLSPDPNRVEEQDIYVRKSETVVLEEAYLTTVEGSALREIPMENGRLMLYVPWAYEDAFQYGGTNVIYWYDVPDPDMFTTPVAMQYYNTTEDPFVIPIETKVVDSEEKIPDPEEFDHPVAVDKKGRKWWLRTEYYYHHGHKARHYELKLVDEDGQTIQPDGPVTVYLPYPDGCSYDNPNITYTLNHYGLGLYTDENQKHQSVTVVAMPKGLRFETVSFSPFVLSWEGDELEAAVQAPALPQTGDNTPLAALSLTAICAAWLALRLRHA